MIMKVTIIQFYLQLFFLYARKSYLYLAHLENQRVRGCPEIEEMVDYISNVNDNDINYLYSISENVKTMVNIFI